MYISGHNEILSESINETDILIEINKSKYVNITKSLLMKGLKYPDFPCGEYKFRNGKFKVNKSVCNIFRLVDNIVFVPEIYSIAYSSHFGLFSIWHSMTFDPTKTVKQVRDMIVNHIITLCKLAVKDTSTTTNEPNIFWLGMVLHTIMDSYSPAHLLRSNTLKNINYDHLIHTYLPNNKLVISDTMKTYLEIITELRRRVSKISAVIEDSDDEALKETVIEVAEKYGIKRKKSIKHLAKLTNFFYFHTNRLQSFDRHKKSILKSKLRSINTKNLSTKHSIVNFYYYPEQKGLFHKKHDLLIYCKKMGLFEDCVSDVKYVLESYMKIIKELKNLDKPIDKDALINLFLNKIYYYLINRTFHIETDCSDISSGFNIVEYIKLHKI